MVKLSATFTFIFFICLVNSLHAGQKNVTVLVPDSRQQGQTWAYTKKKPATTWMRPDFDDSKWQRGEGGFGRQGTPGAVVRTTWKSKNIWLRREFNVKSFPGGITLVIHHDEDVQVFLNGQMIHESDGFQTAYREVTLDRPLLAALKVGKNILAVHCLQTGGGQYIDVGLLENNGKPETVAKAPKIDLKSPQAIAFFEKQVQPILKQNCLRCHGGDKTRGGLKLTSRAGLLKGGDTGSAIDLKQPEKSLILKMVNYVDDYHQMPPNKKLPRKEIDILTRWVNMHAPWSGDNTGTTVVKEENPLITKEAKNYWAYKKPARSQPPRVKNQTWVRNPIDDHILAKLEEKGLPPAPEADRAVLVRRLYYDVIGLPPTPRDVERFIQDKSPRAYENLVDQLLASPQYGEKWGRYWLDLVRYAESNGYEYDESKPDAWRYRDYVVKSFNEDKPYNRFLLEQLAGDELSDANEETRTATIYYRLGIFDTHAPDALQRDFDMYDDVVKTTGEVVLGMTLGCARCHDHKKDPIPQADYYRFLAFVRNIKPAPHGPAREHGTNPRKTHILVRGNAHVEGKEVQPGFPQVLGFTDPKEIDPTETQSTGRRLVLANWIASRDNPLTARVMVNRLWQHHFGRGIVPTPSDFGKLGEAPTHPELLDWLAVEFMERGWSIKHMHRLMLTSSTYRMSSAGHAEGLKADPHNHLFWRFNMRRLTAEEVRDSMLAMDGTLDLKMGGPSVYPELPIEVIRTSSKFNRETGFIHDGMWQRSKPEFEVRRTIYTFIRRSLLPPMMTAFDLADTDSSCPVRFTTTVPTQALTTLNSKFMQDHARLFAQRLEREEGADTKAQIRRGLELVMQRHPSQRELDRATKLVQDLRADGVSGEESLRIFCLMALNLNEFIYVD